MFLLYLIAVFAAVSTVQGEETSLGANSPGGSSLEFARVDDLTPSIDDAEGWMQLVDETWGEGMGNAEKLMFFDTFWHTIDREFACFQDLDVNWEAVRAEFRPEVVAGGVSKGRFAAIMSRLSLALMEAHTAAYDRVVQWRTTPAPGIPLLVVGGWGRTDEFGACLTPVDDGSLVVYSVLENHPLGLAPGDAVVGYEGRSWNELYPQMLANGLPVAGFWGSSELSYEHSWLMAAGANWHLFDSIDLRRFATGEVESLPTSLMSGWRGEIWCTEQLPVVGVEMPDFQHGEVVSWGILEGTSIGYIYGWGWGWDAEQEFFDAIDSIMANPGNEGLIIDFRFNMGGQLSLSDAGLGLLFDRTVPTVDFVSRCDPDDHLGFCEEGAFLSFLIRGDPSSFYDKPIAVLVGPGAVSSGEHVALRMSFHPWAKLFGKPTNAAFNAAALMWSDDEWQATYAWADSYLLSDPGENLTHDLLPVDHEVWLSRDDIAEGRDTVVEASIEWIREFEFAPRQPSGRVQP